MSDRTSVAAIPTSWRFSIRSLLIVVTVVCVLLAPYHWLGFFYLYSVALSATLVVCSALSYANKWPTSPTKLSVIGIFSGFLGIGSLVFILQSLFNLAGSIYANYTRPHPRKFATILVLLAVFPYVFAAAIGINDFRRISALRLGYPMESLETRLEFESNNSQTIAPQNAAIPQISNLVDINLAKLDQQFDDDPAYRATALSHLHDDTYRRFAAAAGFGPARMPVLGTSVRSTQLEYNRDKLTLPIFIREFDGFPKSTAIIHQEVLRDFFRPDSYGDVLSAKRVRGFEAHGPAKVAEKIGIQKDKHSTWQLTRLELIGLLKHDEPRVYIAETIPLMNELDSLPHRPLDKFEARSLPQLATEKDTVIEEFTDGAKMLGAVRAGNDCLQCHNGPRGKLLGAFSYEFHEIQ